MSPEAQWRCVLSWFPLGGVALVMLSFIAEGHYDPVRDDNFPPAMMPAFYIHLVLQVLISAVSSVREIRSRPDPQIKRRPIPVACWLTQFAVWVAYGITCAVTAAAK